MKAQPLLVRVPVVIFAVLVGGIFVYARSGGRLFNTPAQVSPAAVHDVNDPGGSPAIIYGTKSAPAFLPEETPTPVTPISPHATLLPGSKSAVMISPEPSQPTPRLLPGSKSIILVEPAGTTAPNPPPLNNTPTLLPGSKSRAVIDPQTIAPVQQAAPQPKPQPQQQRATNDRGAPR